MLGIYDKKKITLFQYSPPSFSHVPLILQIEEVILWQEKRGQEAKKSLDDKLRGIQGKSHYCNLMYFVYCFFKVLFCSIVPEKLSRIYYTTLQITLKESSLAIQYGRDTIEQHFVVYKTRCFNTELYFNRGGRLCRMFVFEMSWALLLIVVRCWPISIVNWRKRFNVVKPFDV